MLNDEISNMIIYEDSICLCATSKDLFKHVENEGMTINREKRELI